MIHTPANPTPLTDLECAQLRSKVDRALGGIGALNDLLEALGRRRTNHETKARMGIGDPKALRARHAELGDVIESVMKGVEKAQYDATMLVEEHPEAFTPS